MELEDWKFELLMVFVSAMAARAVNEAVDALKERAARRKKGPRKTGKHFREP